MKIRFLVSQGLCLFIIFSSVSSLAAQTRSKSALSLYESAYGAQQAGDYYGAVESYREALQVNPQYGDAWYNLALCVYNLGEYDLAVEYADNALRYSRRTSEIQNLKGMALISLGRLDEARDVFNEVLAKYPNDIDARFGLAELKLYGGSLSSAENLYLDALKRDGKNRKALLSLALVSAEEGKDDIADKYVKQAIEYHNGDPEVYYLASYLATKRGNLTEAERLVRSAIQINSNYDRAYELLSNILYEQKRYNEVMDLCDYRISRNRNLTGAWYLKGLSQKRLGDNEGAIATFSTGLSVDPYDEVMRFALEQIVGSCLSIEDSRRSKWASFHINKAQEFKRNFDGPSERYEYQKALSVDPLNSNVRQSFANMLERDGFYELYLQQLKFIKENEVPSSSSKAVQLDENSPRTTVKRMSQQVKNDDTIEALESMMGDNLAHKWNVDPFYLDKSRWNIGIYFVNSGVQILHADVEEIIALAAGDIFKGVPSTAVNVQTVAVSGYGDAYHQARVSGSDYFIILSAHETDRSFSLDAQVYSGRTGTKTTNMHIYRTGNDRFAKGLRRLRQAVLDILPIRGNILNNATNTLLVDLGKSDGIVKGAVFDVVKQGKIKTVDTGTGVVYNSSDTLGTFTVTKANEEISEGEYKKKGFYDVLNVGDEIVLVKLPDDAEGQSTEGNAVTDTKPAANAEGEPATKAAETAERESLKESMKVQSQESPLINMIRSIL
ncbi:MAG: tetratricopeptide repeat protein [Treponema sp.]|nr:tetratricopeptide repeat protein [Treponema sp.]